MATNNSILYLLKYNNYYNRTIKFENAVTDYLDYLVYEPLTCNFNPADGINTEHTFNVSAFTLGLSADYAIVVNGSKISRWFIIDAIRTRGNQYQLKLHRDVIADYYNEVMGAPTYIQRAMVNIGNSLIFNSENMQYNQIKKSETLLKDETNSPWIVGYCAVNAFDTEVNISVPSSGNVYPEPPVDFDTLTSYGNQSLYTWGDTRAAIQGNMGSSQYNWTILFKPNQVISTEVKENQPLTDVFFSPSYTVQQINTVAETIARYDGLSDFEASIKAFGATKTSDFFITASTFDSIASMNGNTYFDGVRTFKVSLNQTTETIYADGAPSGSAYFEMIKAAVEETSAGIVRGSKGVNAQLDRRVISISVEVLSAATTSTTLGAGLKILRDAPYRMFAIPYDSVGYYTGETIGEFEVVNYTSAAISLPIAAEIAKQLQGGAFLYDLQLLPYCPFRNFLKQGAVEFLGTENTDYSLIKEGDQIKSFILWGESSSFSFNIGTSINVPVDAVEFKVAHETKFCRLVSPNYAGAFEFKPTANRGVDAFEVNCTYKPYSPYIQINPLFKINGLYGGDFNDNRGLVCGGSFSLPLTTDAWKQYQINNKSYADAFNRQIENMEVTYDIQREQAQVAGVMSAFTTGISGAGTGFLLGGGPIGAEIGGVAGTAASVGGLLADLHYSQQLQNEALSFATDQFNLSLQNIRALPTTLSRVSAFDINSKLFPFIEFYEATEEEVNALKNKITYNSMTVNAIDNIFNYIQTEPTFIQGSIIRLPDIEEDYHVATEIAQEIHKGVYM